MSGDEELVSFEGDWVEFEFVEIQPGSHYEDTAITEIILI